MFCKRKEQYIGIDHFQFLSCSNEKLSERYHIPTHGDLNLGANNFDTLLWSYGVRQPDPNFYRCHQLFQIGLLNN